MLLLFLDALLLIFISYTIGCMSRRALERVVGQRMPASLFGDLLLGLLVSAVYFNLISFFLPVNYLVLIPLFGVSLLQAFRGKSMHLPPRLQPIEKTMMVFTTVMIIAYALIPPIHPDSPLYHYHAIYWYESEKVIPGLGNVHGRLAFNPASFIISAAYSFSDLTIQSIYPLNMVLTLGFYGWLIRSAIRQPSKVTGLCFLLTGLLLFRYLLSNISSPASEPLAVICVMFVFLTILDRIEQHQEGDPGSLFMITLVALFALTAKITSALLIILPLCWLIFIVKRQPGRYYVFLLLCCLIILVPWLIRNVILSGYLIYPLFQLDFFDYDWKMPRNAVMLDYFYGTYGVRGEIGNFQVLTTPFGWMAGWFDNLFRLQRLPDAILWIACFSSPLVWLLAIGQRTWNRRMVLVWLIAFAAAIVWFLKAPEFRFGVAVIVISAIIPWICVLHNLNLSGKAVNSVALGLIIIVSTYYGLRLAAGHPRFHSNGIEYLWLKPMKDGYYYQTGKGKVPALRDLGNGVVLYKDAHFTEYIWLRGIPCMVVDYGEIELRGNKIADGFRSLTDEVKMNHPDIFLNK